MNTPNPATLLPHRRPMLMISKIIAYDNHHLTANATVNSDNPLLQEGVLPGYATLEMLAQASGLFLGLTRMGHGEKNDIAEPGAIVSVRDMRVYVHVLTVDAQLNMETECLGGSGDAAMFRGSVWEGEVMVLEASLTVSRFPKGETS